MVHVAKDGMHDLAFRTDRSVILTEHRGKRTKSDWPIRHVQQRAALVSPAESMRSFGGAESVIIWVTEVRPR